MCYWNQRIVFKVKSWLAHGTMSGVNEVNEVNGARERKNLGRESW